VQKLLQSKSADFSPQKNSRFEAINFVAKLFSLIGKEYRMETLTISTAGKRNQEPILRLFNLQLQRRRCGRLERFFK
jgi:hypothetical protein